MEEVLRAFTILYTSDYDKESKDWNWILSRFEELCLDFEKTFQLAKKTNYPHVFAKHTIEFIKRNGSLRWYSNTVLETLLASLKKAFLLTQAGMKSWFLCSNFFVEKIFCWSC